MSVFAGEIHLSEYLGGFLVPTTLRNIVGGLPGQLPSIATDV